MDFVGFVKTGSTWKIYSKRFGKRCFINGIWKIDFDLPIHSINFKRIVNNSKDSLKK